MVHLKLCAALKLRHVIENALSTVYLLENGTVKTGTGATTIAEVVALFLMQ